MTDCQLVILGAFGRIDLSHVTGFVEEQYTGWSGTKWSGSFRIERGSKATDDLFGLLDAAFFSQTKEPVTIYQYVMVPNPPYTGGESRVYQFDNARLSLAPGGVAFSASGRVRV